MKSLLSVVFFVFWANVSSVLAQFPSSYLADLNSGDIKLVESSASGSGMHWYRFSMTNGAEKILLRYMIGFNSAYTGDGFGEFINEPIEGFIWIEAPSSFSSTSFISLPVDLTFLRPESIFDDMRFNPEFQISVFDTSIMTSQAIGIFECGDFDCSGNMESNSVLPCLSEGCGIDATFNFLGAGYTEVKNQFEFDTVDDGPIGQLLFRHAGFFDGNEFEPEPFHFEQTYFTDLSFNFGDANLDGEVNLLDVDAFLLLISLGAYQLESDTNLDFSVDLLDVAGFVQAIIDG